MINAATGDIESKGNGKETCATDWACTRGTYMSKDKTECKVCPTGAICEEDYVVFDTLTSEPGYWQVKDWFKNSNKNLKFEKCYESSQCRELLKKIKASGQTQQNQIR
jgi:hypothetical protein